MDARSTTLARTCLEAAETGALTFPEIVAALGEGGFEGYFIDYRRSTATYHRPDGDSLELPTHRAQVEVAGKLDPDTLQSAIREAQTLAPGYSYRGFCLKAKAAGCAGYLVSFSGRRVVYFGRDGAVHVEHFPGAAGS